MSMPRRIVWVTFAALFLTGCRSTQPGARVDPALSTLVPADTTLLIGIRAEELMRLPVYQRYLAGRPIAPLDEFAARTGLPSRAAIWELLLISDGKNIVLLGRGKISNEAEPRLEAKNPGARRFNYHGYTLVGDEESAVLLLSPTAAAVGDTAGLRRIVDARDESNGPPPVLARRMREVPPEAVIWSAYAGAPVGLPPGLPPNFNNLLKILNSVESGSAYLDLRLGLAAKATGTAATEAAAKELHDALRGLLGLARVGSQKSALPVQQLLDGTRVTQDGANVNIYVDAREEALAALLDSWAARPRSSQN